MAACTRPTGPGNGTAMHDNAPTTRSEQGANADEPYGLFVGTDRFATNMRTGIGTAAKREPWFSTTKVVVFMVIWGV